MDKYSVGLPGGAEKPPARIPQPTPSLIWALTPSRDPNGHSHSHSVTIKFQHLPIRCPPTPHLPRSKQTALGPIRGYIECGGLGLEKTPLNAVSDRGGGLGETERIQIQIGGSRGRWSLHPADHKEGGGKVPKLNLWQACTSPHWPHTRS